MAFTLADFYVITSILTYTTTHDEQTKKMLGELHVTQKTKSDFMTLIFEQVKMEKERRIEALLQQ